MLYFYALHYTGSFSPLFFKAALYDKPHLIILDKKFAQRLCLMVLLLLIHLFWFPLLNYWFFNCFTCFPSFYMGYLSSIKSIYFSQFCASTGSLNLIAVETISLCRQYEIFIELQAWVSYRKRLQLYSIREQ